MKCPISAGAIGFTLSSTNWTGTRRFLEETLGGTGCLWIFNAEDLDSFHGMRARSEALCVSASSTALVS